MKRVSAFRLIAVAGSALGAWVACASGQTAATWLAPVNGAWSDATKWSTNPFFPNNNGSTLYDAAVSVTGAAYTVNLDVPVTIENFTLDSSDATLNIQNANNFTVNRAATLSGTRMTGTSYTGTVRVAGATTMRGVTLTSLGDAFFDGGITFAGAVVDDINDTCVVHGGNGAWTGSGAIRLNGTTEFMISPRSTFTISSNSTLSWNQAGSMGAVENAGTIIKTSTGTTNFDRVQFTNPGTLDIRGGTLSANAFQITGSNLAPGTWKVSGGGNIDLVGVAITTSAADITIDGASSSFGAISGLTTIGTGGKLTLSGGKTFTTAGNFTNNGTLTVAAGSQFTVLAGSTLTNLSSGTLTGGTFNVSGVLKFGTSTIATIDSGITLNGPTAIIETSAGTNSLSTATRITTNGKLTLKGNATFTTGGDFKVDGNNSGVIEVEAGSEFKVASGFSLLNYNSGTKTLSEGDYLISGKLTFAHSGIEHLDSKLTLDGASAQVVDTGNVDALTPLKAIDGFGALTLSNNANFTANPSDAASFTFNVASTGRVSIQEGSQFDINGDLVNYSAGTFTNGDFNVLGTLRARNIADVTTISTPIALASATSRITNFSNTDVFAAVNLITPTGNFTVSNGRALTLTDPTGLTNNGGLTVGGLTAGDTAVVTVNHAFTQSGAGSNTVVQSGGTMIVIGATSLQSGTLSVNGSRFEARGGFLQTGGLANIGSGGLVLVTGAYQLNGGELALAGGELNASGGLSQSGGALTGDGVINGSVVTGGVIDPGLGTPYGPGSNAGRMLFTGNVSLTPGSSINIDLGEPVPGVPTGYDQVSITGQLIISQEAASILRFRCAVRPHAGDVFIPLVFGAMSGQFARIDGLRVDATMFLEPQFTANGLRLTAVEVPALPAAAPLLGLIAMRRRRMVRQMY